MTYSEILCPHCGANGRVENELNSPLLMGRCPMCTRYVLFFCGATLPMEDTAVTSHSLPAVRQHIMDRIDAFLEDRITRFLEAHAEELDLGDENEPVEPEAEARAEDLPAIQPGDVHPSVSGESKGSITSDEVRDFKAIDLHLIDHAWYFEKHFGRRGK